MRKELIMELPHIPHDDLMDVMEMTNKIETYISSVLKDNDRNLAMSALMSSAINSMLAQCKTLDEVMFYRNLFMQILDSSIRTIEIKKPEPPSS
jgi:hypothetical protein